MFCSLINSNSLSFNWTNNWWMLPLPYFNLFASFSRLIFFSFNEIIDFWDKLFSLISLSFFNLLPILFISYFMLFVLFITFLLAFIDLNNFLTDSCFWILSLFSFSIKFSFSSILLFTEFISFSVLDIESVKDLTFFLELSIRDCIFSKPLDRFSNLLTFSWRAEFTFLMYSSLFLILLISLFIFEISSL